MTNSETVSPSEELINSLLEHYQNRRFSDAEKLAVKITQDFPKHQFAWKVLGVLLEARGRKTEAVEANQTAVALSPHDAEAHNNLGNTLKELGRLKEAEASYNQAIVLMPNYAEAHCNLGITLHCLGRLDKSEASYNQAIALKPELAEAHINLGITLQELGRLKEAEASYNQAIVLMPHYAEAHCNLGNVLKELGRLHEAETSFNQAIALMPNFAEAHSNLGVVFQELSRLEEAKVSLIRAIALTPNFMDAARNLVKLPAGQVDSHALNLCENAVGTLDNSLEHQIKYFFFQGNLLKHRGILDQSFKMFCKANKLKSGLSKHKVKVAAKKNIDSLMRIDKWLPSLPQLAGKGLTKLFIMGPSKSGKSSLEHILSKSSYVKTLYETIEHNELLKENGYRRDTNELLFENIFSQSEVKLLNEGFEVVTSTNPGSIFYSDYLVDMLPNTFFIIIKRDLRDVSPEIFTTEYKSENIYSYDANEISNYLDVYYRVCQSLALKVPDRCLTVSFEDIIQAPEDLIDQVNKLVGSDLNVKHLEQNIASLEYESLFRTHYATMINEANN